MRRVNGWNLRYRLPRDFGTQWAMRRPAANRAASSGWRRPRPPTSWPWPMPTASRWARAGATGCVPAGGLPADAFWSITLYEFVEGGGTWSTTRSACYAIGDRGTPGLVRGADGSLELWIQPEGATDATGRANWLPSPPQRRFYMNARLYPAAPEVLDPAWALPAVRRVAD